MGLEEPLHKCQDDDHERRRPKAPNPSADPGVVPEIVQVDDLPDKPDFDVASLSPLLALKMLARGVVSLSESTGDLPASPATVVGPNYIDAKFLVPSTSEIRPTRPPHRRAASFVPSDDVEHPSFIKVDVGSPEATQGESNDWRDAHERRLVSATIARKFFSKKPPPISIDDYLLRLHRYCPMSTAVYLAAASYIHQLAVVDKLVPVTPRTIHRLVLASLRCAMKALEDLNYPSKRFAGVGGVAERELARLEISFLYLVDFELLVTAESLRAKGWALIESGRRRKSPGV